MEGVGTQPRYEPDEFDDLFRRDYPSIVRTVLPIVGDRQQAEAIVQDAFVVALRRWRRIHSYDKPGAWVRRVAIRDAVRFARREARSGPFEVATPAPGPATDQADLVDLESAVASLPAQQRAAVALHYFDDCPTGEIGEALGCSPATVRVHLHRARTTLAKHLAFDSEEEEVS